MLLATPFMATFNTTIGDPGVILVDIWDDTTALTNFLLDLTPVDEVHCHLMGAQEGFSHAKVLKPSMGMLLQDSQPLWFPAVPRW
jgi:hypothetical protein